MKLNVNIGDVIISCETGKSYTVVEMNKCQYKCIDEGGGYTWLMRSFVNDTLFWKE